MVPKEFLHVLLSPVLSFPLPSGGEVSTGGSSIDLSTLEVRWVGKGERWAKVLERGVLAVIH